MHYVRKQRKVGINRIPATLIVVYDMVNGKENGKSKHNIPDLSMQYLSFVRMLGSSQSGRQVPVFESLATRHTLHSVGSGFLDELV